MQPFRSPTTTTSIPACPVRQLCVEEIHICAHFYIVVLTDWDVDVSGTRFALFDHNCLAGKFGGIWGVVVLAGWRPILTTVEPTR